VERNTTDSALYRANYQPVQAKILCGQGPEWRVVYIGPENGHCWVGLTSAVWGVLEKGWFGMVKMKLLFLRERGLHLFRVCNTGCQAFLRKKPSSLFTELISVASLMKSSMCPVFVARILV